MRRLLAAAVLLVAGCAPGSDDTVVTVFAASSLTEVFGEIEKRFERDHPGIDVRVNLGGSARLGHQITEGARGEVFASADQRPMRALEESGELDGEPVVFAVNTPALIVGAGNPAGVEGIGDLERDDVDLVMCAPQVPCGHAGERLLARAGVAVRPVSEEHNVRAVLAKVRAGEATAGLVYRTDARAEAGAVDEVRVPEAAQVHNRYPIATLDEARSPRLAREFVRFVRGEAGQRVLREAGFRPGEVTS